MRADELMIGDWVDTPFLQGIVLSLSRQLGIVEVITVRNSIIKLMAEVVKPIPITSEILKKNGFSDRGNAGWQNPDHDVTYYRTFETFAHNVYQQEHIDIIHGIKYVHEMQHALRQCKLNELASKFEV